MKPSKLNSFPPGRRALVASAMIMLVGAATAAAQTGATGSTKYGSSQTNPPTDTSSSATGSSTAQPGSAYGTGSQSGTTTTSGSTYGSDRTSPSSATSTSSGKLSWSDRRFVTKAADGGQDEIQLAQLAAQRATNAEVRTFAQKLVDDHTKVNSELMSIASQKNVKIDKDNDKDRAYKRLSKKTGSEFDQEFVEHMIDEHEKDIKQFEKTAKDAKDPDVRAFASKHVSDLREHLQLAQNLRQSVMPTGRMDSTSGRSTSGSSADTISNPPSSSSSSTSDGSTTATSGASSATDTSGTSSSTTPKREGSR